jgi:hypothetical protein
MGRPPVPIARQSIFLYNTGKVEKGEGFSRIYGRNYEKAFSNASKPI